MITNQYKHSRFLYTHFLDMLFTWPNTHHHTSLA
uniref:Uncharacterized protein n=1 Tax=Rhizophora mucronata TaxID=61149 RepID=A0A2P2P5A9_RHIMU